MTRFMRPRFPSVSLVPTMLGCLARWRRVSEERSMPAAAAGKL